MVHVAVLGGTIVDYPTSFPLKSFELGNGQAPLWIKRAYQAGNSPAYQPVIIPTETSEPYCVAHEQPNLFAAHERGATSFLKT